MAKLSEQLADLSVRAKSAEDAAAARKEAQDKVVARDKARADATAALQKVDKSIKSGAMM
jgi:hypothetical protein